MPETTKTTVNQASNGQFKTTIPKALAEAYDLDGKKLEWDADGKSGLKVKIHD